MLVSCGLPMELRSSWCRMRILFIEGLPGAGKSTMAEKLCEFAMRSGSDAMWYREEAHDHPVHPKPWGALKHRDDFADVCLQAWSAFVVRCQGDDALHILEGSAFQSTVRFMMENQRCQANIEDYFRRFEDILRPLGPRMIYLRSRDAIRHSMHVSALRGDNWTMRVSSYLEQTRYALHHRLRGVDGMHRFWADYARLCDGLVAKTCIPTCTIDFNPGDWERHMHEAAKVVADHRLPENGAKNNFTNPAI